MPRPLSREELEEVPAAFARAALRAQGAGFRWFEVHAAHGYLVHEFLSPLSNGRTDEYGGSFGNRARLVVVAVRLSSTDWTEGGWNADDTVALAPLLAAAGVDLVDCSSGGNVAEAAIPTGPSYQVAFAERVRRETGVATGAVGMITEPDQADEIIRSGQADLVLLARAFLRDPYWALGAAVALGHRPATPVQYGRAF